MSSELKPASRRSSSGFTTRSIECSASRRRTIPVILASTSVGFASVIEMLGWNACESACAQQAGRHSGSGTDAVKIDVMSALSTVSAHAVVHPPRQTCLAAEPAQKQAFLLRRRDREVLRREHRAKGRIVSVTPSAAAQRHHFIEDPSTTRRRVAAFRGRVTRCERRVCVVHDRPPEPGTQSLSRSAPSACVCHVRHTADQHLLRTNRIGCA